MLTNNNESLNAKQLAIDIAAACDCRELTESFIDILFRHNSSDLRTSSVGPALSKWADDETKFAVKQKLNDLNIHDDDARGYILSILWPSHLVIDELIGFLTRPQQSNYYGSYARFLAHEFPDNLQSTDLPALLEWLKAKRKSRRKLRRDRLKPVAKEIIQFAYKNLDKPNVCSAFVDLVLQKSFTYEDSGGTKNRDIESEKPQRVLFWEELFQRDLPARDLISAAAVFDSALLVPDDIHWVVDKALAENEISKRWISLTFRLFSPIQNPEHLATIKQLESIDISIKNEIQKRTTCSITDPESENWEKRGYYEKLERERKRADQTNFHDSVSELIELYEKGKTWAIWKLDEYLSQDTQHINNIEPNDTSQGWDHLSPEALSKLITLSKTFIEQTNIKNEELYDSSTTYRSYRSGLSLIARIQKSDPRWLEGKESEFWVRWTPVLFLYKDRLFNIGQETWNSLFHHSYEKARPDYLQFLRTRLATKERHNIPSELFPNSIDPNDNDFHNALISAASNQIFDSAKRLFFLRKSFNSNPSPSFSRTKKWRSLHNQNTRHINSLKMRSHTRFQKRRSKRTSNLIRLRLARVEKALPSSKTDAILADTFLLACNGRTYGDDVISRMTSNAPWGRSVIERLNGFGRTTTSWVETCNPTPLSRLWEWLECEYPGDPYDDNHDGAVTISHEVYHLKNYILTRLEKGESDESIEAISGLIDRAPSKHWLGQLRARALQNHKRTNWATPRYRDVSKFLCEGIFRPLTSNGDLCDAVMDSLAQYQSRLCEDTPLTELWNEPAAIVRKWSPKDEDNVADCLKRHLESDLSEYQITAVRESETSQNTPTSKADLPDIVVYSPSAQSDASNFKVVIEVKGAWNDGVIKSIETQLHNRYMRATNCGIHVTAYFTCESWASEDYRKNKSLSRKSYEEAWGSLDSKRNDVQSRSSKRLEIFLLDARIK